MKRPKTYPQQVSAFVGIDRRGNLAWGTIRPTREDCAALCERFQPSLDGHPSYLRIMPVNIGYDLNRQLTFQREGDQPFPADSDT